jgi:hypothetical protein
MGANKMIISSNELKAMSKFSKFSNVELELELKAIEQAIRSYTNNNFQDRLKRIECNSLDGILQATSPYFKVGDTLEISKSNNAGLYVITDISDKTTLDGVLFDESYNLVTKITYPADVVAGALRLLDWKLTKSDKVGVQSESISRHSVTYFNMDGNNSIMGYPKSLFDFLKPYRKAKF